VKATILIGDVLERLRELPEASVDSIVTDPPYELGFMGKAWDSTGIAYSVPMWRECLRVLRPGGYLLSFGGSRTYHRMACAIEDAGFEVRDQIMWIYGSGFPKSLDVSKAIDKAAGVERPRISGGVGSSNTNALGRFTPGEAKHWSGWGTALKPAHEPICVARKPLIGTVAANVLAHGTGALNIDGCRVEGPMDGVWGSSNKTVNPDRTFVGSPDASEYKTEPHPSGRWPANVIHDGSEEVVSRFPESQSGSNTVKRETGAENKGNTGSSYGAESRSAGTPMISYGDKGTAARFFYTAKADKAEREAGCYDVTPQKTDGSRKDGNPGGDNPRNRGVHERGNNHPTVKPLDLMRYLVRLVTRPGGTVLDALMGSGTTGIAAMLEGMNFIGIDEWPPYAALAEKRIRAAAPMFNEVIVLSSDQPWGTSAQEKEEACAGAGKLSGQNNSAPRKEPMTTGGCKQVDDGCALEANDR
jgi:site-specific DNA-methyltransferase (adenine-specific)